MVRALQSNNIKRKRHHLWDPTTCCPAWPSEAVSPQPRCLDPVWYQKIVWSPVRQSPQIKPSEHKKAPNDSSRTWTLDCEPQHCHLPQDRLTHVQLLLAWKPAPLQSSTSTPEGTPWRSVEYLLLQPRSAPGSALHCFTVVLHRRPCVPLHTVVLYIRSPPQHTAIQLHRGWLGHHPFSEPHTSVGELLHIPWRIPTFMATDLLSLAGGILYGVWNEPTLGPVRQQLGSSRIASTAYQ
jgi:hypothetical protein